MFFPLSAKKKEVFPSFIGVSKYNDLLEI